MSQNKKLNQIGDVVEHSKLGKGSWVVVNTKMTGGGTGMGPHDVYPDGHQLELKPIDGKEIDSKHPSKKFYQSGCFTDSVMIPYMPPVREVVIEVRFVVVAEI